MPQTSGANNHSRTTLVGAQHCCVLSRQIHRVLPACGTLLILHSEHGMPSREDAWKLLCEYTQNESLRKHALAVEACVRAYARKNNADEELWGITALLHDFDYERWPNDAHSPVEEHPAGGSEILRQRGYSEDLVRAIVAHADYCNVPRETPLEHTLFA